MVDEQTPSRLQRPRHFPEGGHVVALAEVAEARVDTNNGVELFAIGEPPHIATREPETLALVIAATGLAEHRARQVDTDDRIAAPGQLAGMPPEAAGHVEHAAARLQTESLREEVDLRPCPPRAFLRREDFEIRIVEESAEPLAGRHRSSLPRAATR